MKHKYGVRRHVVECFLFELVKHLFRSRLPDQRLRLSEINVLQELLFCDSDLLVEPLKNFSLNWKVFPSRYMVPSAHLINRVQSYAFVVEFPPECNRLFRRRITGDVLSFPEVVSRVARYSPFSPE
jgi:hypothetical protein